MKNVFPKKVAKCVKCKTPLQGYNLFKIGSLYYCIDHYQKEKEKVNNDFQDTRLKNYNKLVNG